MSHLNFKFRAIIYTLFDTEFRSILPVKDLLYAAIYKWLSGIPSEFCDEVRSLFN